MAALANMVSQGGVPPGLGSDPASNIANIANLMRLGVSQVRTNPKTSYSISFFETFGWSQIFFISLISRFQFPLNFYNLSPPSQF